MTVRPAEEGDYAAADRLFQIAMGENFTLDPALWKEACQSSGYRVLVADMEGAEAAGIVVVVVTDRIRLAAGTRRRRFHIDQLIVLPEHRRKGIAQALLNQVAAAAQAQSPSYIIANCDFTNVAARRAYEAVGFHLVRQSSDRFEIAFP